MITLGLFAVLGAGPVLSGGMVAGFLLVPSPLMGPAMVALILL
jgi:hypothetical protein